MCLVWRNGFASLHRHSIHDRHTVTITYARSHIYPQCTNITAVCHTVISWNISQQHYFPLHPHWWHRQSAAFLALIRDALPSMGLGILSAYFAHLSHNASRFSFLITSEVFWYAWKNDNWSSNNRHVPLERCDQLFDNCTKFFFSLSSVFFVGIANIHSAHTDGIDIY